MNRNELLRQKQKREDALKEVSKMYNAPDSIKYDLCDESGQELGALEYEPKGDCVKVYSADGVVIIDGYLLRPLRNVLNKLFDE